MAISNKVKRDIGILQRRIDGATYIAIAKEFDLNAKYISAIVSRQITAIASLEASSQLRNARLESQLLEELRHSEQLTTSLHEASLLIAELKKQVTKRNRVIEQTKGRVDALTKKCAELELSMEEWKGRAMQRSEPKTYKTPVALKHLK